MDELVKMVAQKSGITPEQASTATETVINFLKQQLPAPIASQIDAAMRGDIAGIAGSLGGMMGKR